MNPEIESKWGQENEVKKKSEKGHDSWLSGLHSKIKNIHYYYMNSWRITSFELIQTEWVVNLIPKVESSICSDEIEFYLELWFEKKFIEYWWSNR